MAHHHHHRDRYGNPDDRAEYLRRLEGPDRAEWQKPVEVLEALALRPAQVACDIGAGPGYFSLRLAGLAARVFAVEAEPQMLATLRERIAASGARNVTPVLALQDDPLLPPASCDLALIVNTFHHFPDGADYLRRLARALRRGGRIVNIDFHDRELPIGPPPGQKLSREQFLAVAEAAGLRLAKEHRFLPYQYFLELKTRRAR
jgi:ubiquinone/menaquinone biosynthesis C-methylase UbiE